MLSAHAQRLLFGLARFVKECFPSRRITKGHALYNETFAKVLQQNGNVYNVGMYARLQGWMVPADVIEFVSHNYKLYSASCSEQLHLAHANSRTRH